MNRLQIIEEMKVQPTIDPAFEIDRRIAFIQRQLQSSGLTSLVLGISGGIDSCTLGKLAQLAIDDLNQQESSDRYAFYALRLPYGKQHDEADAQAALDFIQPTHVLTLDVMPGADAVRNTVESVIPEAVLNAEHADFVTGNTKARIRMVLQYHLAGLKQGLVLGTDHSAENITGFYTKYGDGACDLAPLFGLSKRQVRQIASYLSTPDFLVNKTPTADLETLSPQKADEDVLGLTYDEIDDFLEARPVAETVEQRLVDIFLKTQHKRVPIPTVYDL